MPRASNFSYEPTSCPRDCPERSAECHATCKRYAAYAKRREELRRARASEQEYPTTGYSLYLKRHGRYMKQKNTK